MLKKNVCFLYKIRVLCQMLRGLSNHSLRKNVSGFFGSSPTFVVGLDLFLWLRCLQFCDFAGYTLQLTQSPFVVPRLGTHCQDILCGNLIILAAIDYVYFYEIKFAKYILSYLITLLVTLIKCLFMIFYNKQKKCSTVCGLNLGV